ncbi:unnamed protein product, partial [Auanema sp. JU1783]
WDSQAVSDPSSYQVRRCLTCEIGLNNIIELTVISVNLQANLPRHSDCRDRQIHSALLLLIENDQNTKKTKREQHPTGATHYS